MCLVSVQQGVGSRAVRFGVEEHLGRVSGADILEEQARRYRAPSGNQRLLSLSALSGLAVLLAASGTPPRLLDVGYELLLVCSGLWCTAPHREREGTPMVLIRDAF